jgi:CspA family cold shock protein
MAIGKVRFFNKTKGFGFIKIEDHPDVFLHHTSLNNPKDIDKIEKDVELSFEIAQGTKGLQALNVDIAK